MLRGALAGTDKFRTKPELERDHIFKMLEANDVPGLKAVAEKEGNPLRSFSTGLKVSKTLLANPGVEKLPLALHRPLQRLSEFYDCNPQLIKLGDSSAYSDKHPRTTTEVTQLRNAFNEAEALLDNLKWAFNSLN